MKKLLLGIMLCVSMVFGTAGSASAAWNPFGDACRSGGSDSAVCSADGNTSKDPLSGNDGIIIKIANFVAVIAGIAAVIIIVLAGLRMVTSGGSTEDITGARRTLTYALVGLVVIVLARAIVGLVLGML